MKMIALALIISFVHMSSAGRALITLNEKNAPLEKILAAIEKQTKYVFLYDPEELKMVTITIYVKNATLPETLEKCFKGLPIAFIVIGNHVLLKKKRPENDQKIMIANVRIAAKIIDQQYAFYIATNPPLSLLNKYYSGNPNHTAETAISVYPYAFYTSHPPKISSFKTQDIKTF